MIQTKSPENQPQSGNFRANQTQALLLQAALWSGEDAIKSWQAWIEQVDIEKLDTGSNRLLPLLYRNLSQLGVQHPVMTRLKGIYRHTWSKNQLRLLQLKKVLERFENANISTVLLKGIGLLLVDYQDFGVRQMSDVDVWVHPQQIRKATSILRDEGWYYGADLPEQIEGTIALRHASPFKHPDGWNLDLHWRLFSRRVTSVSHLFMWDNRVPACLMGGNTAVLHPSDRFVHVCAHGYVWNPIPPIRWIADAYKIWQNHQDSFDWEKVVNNSIQLQMSLLMYDCLTYLKEILAVPVPDHQLERIKSSFATVSSLESFRHSNLQCILDKHYNPTPNNYSKNIALEILKFQYYKFWEGYDIFQDFNLLTRQKIGSFWSYLWLGLHIKMFRLSKKLTNIFKTYSPFLIK